MGSMGSDDIKDLKKLIKILEESDLQNLEVEIGERRFKLGKPAKLSGDSFIQVPAAVAPQPTNEDFGSIADGSKIQEDEKWHKVVSPMVGTVYLRSSPDDDIFVSVGDSVKVGDVICLVEAMKVFSKIKADKSGVIKSVKVEDGQAVEYGQTLFTIEG